MEERIDPPRVTGQWRTAPAPPLRMAPAAPAAPVEDGELLRRIAGRDRDALAALYERYGRIVLAQIDRMVGDRALSEEILQDTMLAVWHGASAFEGRSRPRSWIIAIARRKARDRLRRGQLDTADYAALENTPDSQPGPESLALERADAAAVAGAISRLSRAHQEVLGLVFGASLTLAEAAEALEVPVGTVKSRLFAARAALGRRLMERGASDEE